LWRLRAPADPGEIRRTERWLATARVFLAISALVAVWMDPGEIRRSAWAFWLLGFYIVHGVLIMLLLRFRQRSTPAFRLLVHGADIVWPALICSFTTGQGSPFFLFFVFVLAAAAYRWGAWETAGTAVAAVLLLWVQSFLIHLGVADRIDQFLLASNLPPLHLNIADYEPKSLFMHSTYLIVIGLLLGYLAEQQKQLRAEKVVIARVLGRARVESGLTGTLQDIVGELLTMYGSKHALIASQETSSQHIFVAEVRNVGNQASFQWLAPAQSDRDVYLYECPAETSYVWRKQADSLSLHLTALNADGIRLRDLSPSFLDRLAHKHQFRSLMAVSFVFGKEWWGRVFLFDPALTGETEEELRFLNELVWQVGPAIYNVYLLRRLRLRAGAMERARFARELHDGAVQSLIAVEMQVDVLRRQSINSPELVTPELGRIQGLLREEVLNLRELMQQMKSLDMDARKLPGFLTDTVERFQRETGIAARLLLELQDFEMPQQVCREIARIVQEGLVNIRKHSQAKRVLVRLGSLNGKWNVVIEDDGRGFPFSGKFSQEELNSSGKGPAVIQERVRLIEGELTIESNPGHGSRLEITVPQKREAAYG
jgi:signal transduction histidine kinase